MKNHLVENKKILTVISVLFLCVLVFGQSLVGVTVLREEIEKNSKETTTENVQTGEQTTEQITEQAEEQTSEVTEPETVTEAAVEQEPTVINEELVNEAVAAYTDFFDNLEDDMTNLVKLVYLDDTNMPYMIVAGEQYYSSPNAGIYRYENGSVYNIVTGTTAPGLYSPSGGSSYETYGTVYYSKDKRLVGIQDGGSGWHRIIVYQVEENQLIELINVYELIETIDEENREFSYSVNGQDISEEDACNQIGALLGIDMSSFSLDTGDTLEYPTATTVEEAWSQLQNQ
jgi:hypothetical protein